MPVRNVRSCLIRAVLGPAVLLTAGLSAGCSSTEAGSAVPGIVATTTVTSLVTTTQQAAASTVIGPPATSMVTATTSVTVATTVLRPTTVTVTASARSTTVPARTTPRTPAPGTTPNTSGWTHQPNSDGVGAQTFPDSLPGWTMTNNWQSGPRAFSTGFTPADGPDGGRFPSTMNGCDGQRFLVLWHVQNVQITAAYLDDTGASQTPVTGSTGWFDLDSCETPAFQAMAASGGIADVSVDVQQYVPAG